MIGEYFFIVGLWPGVEGQHGGLGVGVEGEREVQQNMFSLSAFSTWAKFRPRPEAESFFWGSV